MFAERKSAAVSQTALLDRFLRYVAIDTQSSYENQSVPSTEGQWRLLHLLEKELNQMGAHKVTLHAQGYLTATIAASLGCEQAPVIGFLAHVDTSPDCSGAGVQPQIIKDYQGEEIPLEDGGIVLNPKQFPELSQLHGHTLLTTRGDTLLGADNKAGVAIIMTLAHTLLHNPDWKHGTIRIAFTTDEETGRGVDNFDVSNFGAQFAYTIDGGAEGEIEYENFNASAANIAISGSNIHPGEAKGKMINALQLAHELHALLPSSLRPECTEGYEGFIHLTECIGSVEQVQMHYIIREHDAEKFCQLEQTFRSAVDSINKRFQEESRPITLKITPQYRNMKEMVLQHPQLIQKAKEAMQMAGVKPIEKPIRGGTDGARLSYMGLPCPNLFTGGANFHGRYEYCSLHSMERAVHTLLNLVSLWSQE